MTQRLHFDVNIACLLHFFNDCMAINKGSQKFKVKTVVA